MNDENERSVASGGSVADIIDRLLAAVKADAPIQRALVVSAAAEIERLRFAIRRLAEQDATLSVCDGNVTVTMDATLTDEEREVLRKVLRLLREGFFRDSSIELVQAASVIDGLLDRQV